MEYLFFYAVFALIFSLIIGSISQNKGRGFAVGFVSSLLLTPVIGIVIVLVMSPDKEKVSELLKLRDEEKQKYLQSQKTRIEINPERLKIKKMMVFTSLSIFLVLSIIILLLLAR